MGSTGKGRGRTQGSSQQHWGNCYRTVPGDGWGGGFGGGAGGFGGGVEAGAGGTRGGMRGEGKA